MLDLLQLDDMIYGAIFRIVVRVIEIHDTCSIVIGGTNGVSA